VSVAKNLISVLIGEYEMIIKNDKFELEISEGTGVYFGSKASGQHFRKWEDFKSEKTFLTDSNNRNKEDI
jgi:hypothetical protein